WPSTDAPAEIHAAPGSARIFAKDFSMSVSIETYWLLFDCRPSYRLRQGYDKKDRRFDKAGNLPFPDRPLQCIAGEWHCIRQVKYNCNGRKQCSEHRLWPV